MVINFAKRVTTALFLALVVWSCKDSGTGAEPDSPPVIPDITVAQPDFSYFESPAMMADQTMMEGEAYATAQGTVMGAGFMFAFGQLGTAYFEMARDQESEFKNGQWVWSYSAAYDGESMEVRLVATVDEDANEVQWAYYISSSGGDVEYNELKLMGGTTSLDGKTGDWAMYGFDDSAGQQAVMAYDWSVDSDENLKASFEFPSDDANTSLIYMQDGSRYTLTINNINGTVEVYWDVENDQGYWWDKTENEKLCWSSGKANIACGDIGL